MNKYVKEDLEDLLIEQKLTYKQIGNIYNVSGVNIRKICIRLGIEIPNRYNRGLEKNKVYCTNCNKEINNPLKNTKYCNNKCQGEFKNKENINFWLKNQDLFKNSLISIRYLKPYILSIQDHRCKICDMKDIWNGKKLIFVLDHIDGNASNNIKENLRLICHNCDSQLPTYKSKNKNSARIFRYNKKNT